MSSLLDTTAAAGRLESVKAALLILALPLLAAACGGTNASSGATTAAAPPPATTSTTTTVTTEGSTQTVVSACATAGLTVSAKDGEAGMGHRSTVYILTNATQAPCSIYGYPGMAFLDASDNVLRDAVARGDSRAGDSAPPAGRHRVVHARLVRGERRNVRELSQGPGHAAERHEPRDSALADRRLPGPRADRVRRGRG